MLRRKGLNQGPAGLFSPARPAHHLGQQGKGALPRPEVIHKQGLVGQHHPDQGHIFKVQSFCHHLGPHQEGRLPPTELLQDGLVGAGGGDGVRIHPQHRRPGKKRLQLLLDLLRAHANEIQFSAAVRAGGRQGLGVAAVVAHQPAVGRMVGQLDRTAGALRHRSTLPTGHHAAGPPAVEEQDGLLPPDQGVLQGLLKGAADGPSVSRPQLLLHVHHLHLGQGPAVEALLQCEQPTPPGLGAVHGLHRGGGRPHHQQGPALDAAVLGHVPGVVAGVVL